MFTLSNGYLLVVGEVKLAVFANSITLWLADASSTGGLSLRQLARLMASIPAIIDIRSFIINVFGVII